VDIKIIIPVQTQSLFIIAPTLLTLSIIAIYFYQSKRYSVKKYETHRNENILFRSKGVDAILRVDKMLNDYILEISHDGNKGIKDKLSPIPGGDPDQ
jgi:hypothetical protein